jgi:hypothetical protein
MLVETPSILITDDDHGFRETVRGMFEPRGFRTYLAADGEEALRIVGAEPVHLLLLDMHMPRLTAIRADVGGARSFDCRRSTVDRRLLGAAKAGELPDADFDGRAGVSACLWVAGASCVLRTPVLNRDRLACILGTGEEVSG